LGKIWACRTETIVVVSDEEVCVCVCARARALARVDEVRGRGILPTNSAT